MARWLNAGIVSARWIVAAAGVRAVVMIENIGASAITDLRPARIPKAQDRVQKQKKDLHMRIEGGEQGVANSAFEGRLAPEV